MEAKSTKINVAAQKKSVILKSLDPFTLYVINISAFTRKGEGSHASVEMLTDEGREYLVQCIFGHKILKYLQILFSQHVK